MNKPHLAGIFKGAQMFVSRHSPEILTGIGIAGMITTTVLAVKATPKALMLLDEEKKALDTDELTPVEVVKTTWKCYIPAAVTGVASAACLIGASSVNLKRNAALATAYKLSETALSEYREKVVETVGEKKERTIREKVAKEKLEKNPIGKSQIIVTEKGNTQCYDAISGRRFKSDMEIIKRAQNELNKRMLDEMYISLNEFYDELGLPHISLGDELGWNIDSGLLDLEFSSHLEEDGTPCLVINYNISPKYGYDRLM